MYCQNNCFLISAVQVLWHLDIFRSFRDIKGHTCTSDSCIFCALKFQCSRESVLPPDALRLALAETFFDQLRFQLGFMDDALECFENILMRIHFHLANHEPEDMCTASHCIPHQKFSMILIEQNVCHECGATSEPLLFTQLIHYVSSSALCSEASLMIKKQRDPTQAFGYLLQRAGSMGEIRNCQSSCVAKIQIYKTLMNHPEIVSIGIVWESENPTLDHIMNVIKTIGLTVNLQDMFHSVIDHKWANSTTHQLVGIVTYYDKHYSTFFFHTKLWSWLYFDDASVSEIGPRWEQVIDKCYRGYFKPLLLLYADPHGSPVSSETAQKLVTVITGHSKCTSGKGLKEDKETICTVPIHLNQFNGNQRRAFTPNPETSGENLSNIPPRRAITPSRELSYTNEFDSQVTQCSFDNSMIDTNYLVSSSKHPYLSTANPSCMFSSFQNHLKHPLTSVWPQHQHDGHYGNRIFHLEAFSPCKLTEETFKCRSNISSFQNKMFSGGIPEMKPEIRRISCPTSHTMSQHSSYAESENGKTYIRREAVESILKAQKLQWQKTMNESFRSLSKSGITSFSSTFCDRTFKPQDLIATTNDITLKVDIPDLSTFERRDSGNWSGDCHSASSMSTSSIDNGFPGMIINSRLNNNMLAYGNLEQVYVDSKGQVRAGDHGYDSYSISSTESCLSATTNSSEKPEPQLIQIDEDKQMHFPKSDNVEASEKCFLRQQQAKIFRDDCNKLCVQADALQIKSQKKEGQLQVAILPSDVAAAKARKANDATFSNLKSSMASKMKHRRCVIRSSTIHRNPKELRNDDCKYKDAVFKTNYSKNSDRVANQKHSRAVNPQKNNNEFLRAQQFGTGVNENVDKPLQVSKPHPMKSSKCNDNCEVFEETVNQQLSENLLEDLAKCHISSFSFHPKSQNDNRLTTENFSKRTNLISDKERSYQEKTDQSKLLNQQISIKNEILTSTKKSNKSSLQRTNSVPSTSLNDDFEKSSDIANRTFASQPRKKQHKIQRKCFSGFMQRKNYSLPDLREKTTQDDVQTNPLDDSDISDTLQFINSQQFKISTPDDFPTRIQEPTDSKSSHQNSHENKISTSNKILQRQETSMAECNYYPEESKSLFTHHLASVRNSSQNVNYYFTKDKSSTSKCSYHLNRSSYLGSGYLPNTNESQKNDRQCSQFYNYSTKKIPSKFPSSQQELITSFNNKIKGPLSRYQEMKTTIPQDLFRNHSSDEVEWFKELQQKQVQLLQKRRLRPYRNLRLEDSQSVENRSSYKTLSEAQKTPEVKNFHQLLQRSKMEFNRNIKRNQAYTSYVKCFQRENDPASRTEIVTKPSDQTESILRDENKSSAEHFQVTGDIILSVPSDMPLTMSKQTESQNINHPEKQLFDGPPDYETTLRRLELFQNKWSSTDATIF
ncbi:uncharacterized protein LOC143246336 isoform X2 [Tachypleus tridentatus]|uniref:uncharacterized protein LOC143246336 isoform X2 n=1 Tax=Tachypleus tridentatus TaxID=6853 RepID=UPI003FD56BC8